MASNDGTQELDADVDHTAQESNTNIEASMNETDPIMLPPKTNNKVEILVIGPTGHGKSSLINKLVGREVAVVDKSCRPTQHKSVEKITNIDELPKEGGDGVQAIIYDSRGFGDPNTTAESIIEEAKEIIKTVGVVVICQRLYDKVDDNTVNVSKNLAKVLGNDMKHCIIACTHGDLYRVRDELENKSEDKISPKMEKKRQEVASEIKCILKAEGIDEQIVDEIPSIITSGTKLSLPTSEKGWVNELWGLMAKRCKPEVENAISWLQWAKDNKMTIALVVVGIVVVGIGLTVYLGGASGVAAAGIKLGLSRASGVAAAGIKLGLSRLDSFDSLASLPAKEDVLTSIQQLALTDKTDIKDIATILGQV